MAKGERMDDRQDLSVASRQSSPRRRAILVAGVLAAAALAAPALAYEAVLYEKTSAYASIVVTDEGDGLRALRFGRNGVRQSLVKPGDPEFLGLPYTRVALTGLALCEEPRRMLVVGLGGGTLPAFLRRHYPDAVIDAVDIDPEVAFVAREYFGFKEDALMRIHVADGRKFIESVRQPYDVIFLDAFGSDAVPPHLTTQEFLRAVRRAVSPGGVVIGNIWDRAYNRLYDSMVRTYREVFEELFVVGVADSGNRILFALPRRQPLARDELARLVRDSPAAKRFRFDMGELVQRGLLPAEGDGGGSVLRDAALKKKVTSDE